MADCLRVLLPFFSRLDQPPGLDQGSRARPVRISGTFACRGLFKSSPYCRGSLFFPRDLSRSPMAWVLRHPRLDKKPADPCAEPPDASLHDLNPPLGHHPDRSFVASNFSIRSTLLSFLQALFLQRYRVLSDCRHCWARGETDATNVIFRTFERVISIQIFLYSLFPRFGEKLILPAIIPWLRNYCAYEDCFESKR